MTNIPAIDGIAASHLQLPAGPWRTVFEALCAHFPQIDAARWRKRFVCGRVLAADGQALSIDADFRAGARIHYYREVENEAPIPFEERIVYQDARLLIADKPHFLPVTPAGGHVRETLLGRLQRRTGNADLVPLHRIDRGTAGLVLFSQDPASRSRYQALFREQRIEKRYQALAPALPAIDFPYTRRSRIVRAEPFFRMDEVPGEPNSATRIEVLDRSGPIWRYALTPISGRKHQLRVHLAALGAAILNDPYYPSLREPRPDDPERPMQLLAQALRFADPIDGSDRHFETRLSLAEAGGFAPNSPLPS